MVTMIIYVCLTLAFVLVMMLESDLNSPIAQGWVHHRRSSHQDVSARSYQTDDFLRGLFRVKSPLLGSFVPPNSSVDLPFRVDVLQSRSCSAPQFLSPLNSTSLEILCAKSPFTVTELTGYPPGSVFPDYNDKSGRTPTPARGTRSVQTVTPKSRSQVVHLRETTQVVEVLCGDEVNFHVRSTPQIGEFGPSREPVPGPDMIYHILDSVSWPVFMRMMPQTVRTLEHLQTSGAEVFHFLHFVQATGGTGANIPRQLSNCAGSWNEPTPKFRPDKGGRWIGDLFEQLGYATGFSAEGNTPIYGGGAVPARDVYLTSTTYGPGPPSSSSRFNRGEPWGNETVRVRYAKEDWRTRCAGGQGIWQSVFNFSRSFMKRTARWNRPRFLYQYNSEAHEGTRTVINLLDADLASFLSDMFTRTSRPLFYVLAADHGICYGEHAKNPFGKLECKLPLLIFVVTPGVLSPEQIRHLRHNERKVVLATDLYPTLASLLGKRDVENRGESLIDTLLPVHRKCDMPFAACPYISKPLSPHRNQTKLLVYALNEMNALVLRYPCARFLPQRATVIQATELGHDVVLLVQYSHPNRGKSKNDKLHGILPSPVLFELRISGGTSVVVERQTPFAPDESKCAFPPFADESTQYRHCCLCILGD